MRDMVQKCIEWNAARYDQAFDYELAVKLLLEETQELFDARTPVDAMDAVGDIVFVAMGVLWKLGLTEDQVRGVFMSENLSQMGIEDTWHWANTIQLTIFDVIDPTVQGAYPGSSLALYSSLVTALGALRGMGMQPNFYDVCNVICDSNDTKEIKGKVDPTVKANVVKGSGYVGPQYALQQIRNNFLMKEEKRGKAIN